MAGQRPDTVHELEVTRSREVRVLVIDVDGRQCAPAVAMQLGPRWVDTRHLLFALLEQPDGLVPRLCSRRPSA